MPDRNSSAAQVQSISDVCPRSGCSSSPPTITAMIKVAAVRARMPFCCIASENSHAAITA